MSLLAIGCFFLGFFTGVRFSANQVDHAKDRPSRPGELSSEDVSTMLDNSKINRAKMDVSNLAKQADIFYVNHNRYPNGVQELTVQVEGMAAQVPHEMILDPWNKAYQMNVVGERVVVFTEHNGRKISNLDVK